jgi:hypothetical protein
MRHIVAALVTTAAVICLVIILAHELQPYLPWIFALIFLGWIIRLVWRS